MLCSHLENASLEIILELYWPNKSLTYLLSMVQIIAWYKLKFSNPFPRLLISQEMSGMFFYEISLAGKRKGTKCWENASCIKWKCFPLKTFIGNLSYYCWQGRTKIGFCLGAFHTIKQISEYLRTTYLTYLTLVVYRLLNLFILTRSFGVEWGYSI